MNLRSLRAGALCALFALLPLCAPASQSASISGTVVDQSTGLALPDATVATVPASSTARSNASGYFSIALPAGRYVVQVRRAGYQPSATAPLTLVAGVHEQVTIALERASNDLSVIGETTVRASSTLRNASAARTLPLCCKRSTSSVR
jgi:hypothetical protein